jgi:outer membrane protein, multidrug efflux system
MNRRTKLILPILAALAFSGCAVGPRYKRPSVEVPQSFRGADASSPEPSASGASTASMADEKWWVVFDDPELQRLIRTALQENYDVRIAAQRVLEAQAQAGITRAQQLPTLDGKAGFSTQRTPAGQIAGFPSFTSTQGTLQLSAAWQLDFWGLYRRQTEAARAQLLATQWGRRATTNSLITDVATAYLELRTLDAQLEIAKRTLAARRESLQLTEKLESGGATSLADVRQAQQLLYTATTEIADLERQITQQENQISVLLGHNPGPIARGNPITRQPRPVGVPAGLPSQLLERRPDIRQAEEQLIAANAQVGVARAQFFPQIALTGSTGTASDTLTRLFANPAFLYSYGASLTQPLFNGGKLRNNLRLTEAQKQEQVLTYQKTISGAFRDISNALIACEKYREFREEQEKLAFAAEDAMRLARLRYDAGATSYIEVLTTDTNYLSAELTLATAQQNEALSLVQLYNALGGGWQEN